MNRAEFETRRNWLEQFRNVSAATARGIAKHDKKGGQHAFACHQWVSQIIRAMMEEDGKSLQASLDAERKAK